MAGEDLGSLIPQGIGDVASAAGNTWSSLVSDPDPTKAAIKQNALISAGLQLMAGGTGNTMQQFAQAGGKAAQSAGETVGAMQEAQRHTQAGADKKEASALDRKSHEEVARIGADSRQEVAQVKIEGMLERSRLIHGPQNDKEMQIYSKARSDFFKKEKDNQILSRKSDSQILAEADTYAKEQLRGARDATGVRSQGAPLESGGPAPISGAPGPSPTPGQPGAGAQSAPKPTWDQIKSNPKIQELLQSAAGRKTLVRERPDLRDEIERHSIQGYEN